MGRLKLRPWIEDGRELDAEDYDMMNLPEKFWDVSWDRVSDGPCKEALEGYIRNLQSARQRGIGLMLIGPNGVGKSSAAALILKHFRSHGQTALFARSEELREASISDWKVSDDYWLWDWSKRVDVLMIDDLGKEYRGKSGFAEYKFENLLRKRHDAMKVTIVTSNLEPEKIKSSEIYKPSTTSIMRSMMILMEMLGENLRVSDAKDEQGGLLSV